MRINLRPYPGCWAFQTKLNPLQYVLFVGKHANCVPVWVPGDDGFVLTVFLDPPSPDPTECVEFFTQHRAALKATIDAYLIAPCHLN